MTARKRTAKTLASGAPAAAAAGVDSAKSGQCRYLLISACRDEAKYMRQTLDSVISQSIPPIKWVVVDDGSTDGTPQILAEYQAKHPWIEVVTRSNRGKRSVGPGVIDAFYAGYET
jgi:cellulose synthase/poly-beta-1,6-N-acetylglucosamine synthase-like glycosyltransferase